MPDEDPSADQSTAESLKEMMRHLESAKKLNKERKRPKRKPRLQGLQKKMAERSDTAVLASNFPARLEELATYDAVTHRSGKPWVSAKIGVDAHGRLPIYYRQDGIVTHTGVITRIILNPNPESEEAKEFLKHITESDTYSDNFDELDKTTYIVEQGTKLAEPFPQTELIKVRNNEPIDEGYSRQPSFVFQRKGDF
ncbi:hypothetical protein [Haladaptatus sp. YSMS36]|uniref:hypothetical protein n=1 Tax=Haladaptatus sp. YSMS36 TaxID=3033384 RepID=UPI0023E8A3D4|nr:hypothetical protein [Haladaptatus sp. YSMS36]